MSTPTKSITLYRVCDDRLEVATFAVITEKCSSKPAGQPGWPRFTYYTRKLGEDVDRVFPMPRPFTQRVPESSEPVKLEYDWCFDAASARTDAVEKAEIRVEACEERLRVARERLLAVQSLKVP